MSIATSFQTQKQTRPFVTTGIKLFNYLEHFDLLTELFRTGCFQLDIENGGFKIDEGRFSPYMLSIPPGKLISSFLLKKISDLFARRITLVHSGPDFIISAHEETLHLAAAAAISLTSLRKKETYYNGVIHTNAGVEVLKGTSLRGKSVIIIDSMTITGGDLFKAIRAVERAGGKVDRVLTFFNPQEIRDRDTPFSVRQCLFMRGIDCLSLMTMADLIEYLNDTRVNKAKYIQSIEAYRKVWAEKKDLTPAYGNVGYCY